MRLAVSSQQSVTQAIKHSSTQQKHTHNKTGNDKHRVHTRHTRQADWQAAAHRAGAVCLGAQTECRRTRAWRAALLTRRPATRTNGRTGIEPNCLSHQNQHLLILRRTTGTAAAKGKTERGGTERRPARKKSKCNHET